MARGQQKIQSQQKAKERQAQIDKQKGHSKAAQSKTAAAKLTFVCQVCKIENGRVTLLVENEFEVSLTLMGDTANIPWRLLDIDILVEDKDTGDGKALVHSLQVRYIHELIQSRLIENPRPLHELYCILHSFCQSLQLEVLHSQTWRLCRERLDNYIKVEEYVPGKLLTISYWRELSAKDPKSQLGYKLTVQIDPHDSTRPLQVLHTPSLTSTEIPEQAIKSYHISMERLLVHTIYVRTKARLHELRQEFQDALGPAVECTISGSPILQPCLKSEQLLISVDTHTGVLLVHVPQYESSLTQEIQLSLNDDKTTVHQHITELRYWIMLRRIEKTLQHLPATPHEKLPLMYNPNHPINKISKHRMFILLHRHPSAILVVELKVCESSPCEMDHTFYLMLVKPASIEDDPEDETVQRELPKSYLMVTTLIEFDSFIATHGPFTKVDQPSDSISGKRKFGGASSGSAKRRHLPASFIPEIAHVVAMCDERIPFATLSHELEVACIAHQGVSVEACGTSMALRIVKMPDVPGVVAGTMCTLRRSLLSVAIRVQLKPTTPMRFWVVELIFWDCPLQSQSPKEQGLRRPVYLTYDMSCVDSSRKAVESMQRDWGQVAHLYDVVLDFKDYLDDEKSSICDLCCVKSFTYRKLTLGYGPNHASLVTIYWCTEKGRFILNFGMCGGSADPPCNSHNMLRDELEREFNSSRSLPHLIKILHETFSPLVSVSKLPNTPQLGMIITRPQIPIQSFVVIPQSVYHIRIVYCGLYCLDVHFRGDGLMALKDGAYSLFDKAKVMQEFSPTQGLKTFLCKYVDESTVMSRRRSQSEDDNPPSPMLTSDTGGMLKPGSPGASPALRFPTPHTPPSNPHTPASPHTTNLAQGSHSAYGSSPGASFSLTSPPSIGSVGMHPSPNPLLNSPSPSVMPTPSPSGGILHSPSAGGLITSAGTHYTSRVLPNRWWAGAIPTLLTHEGFESMCTPCASPDTDGSQADTQLYHSPLERFLGAVYVKKHLQKMLQQDKELGTSSVFSTPACSEAGVIVFKVDQIGLQCSVSIDSTHMQSVKIKLTHVPDTQEKLTNEELQVLEHFFDSRVVTLPVKPNNIQAFCRVFQIHPVATIPSIHPLQILRECIHIIKLEMVPLTGAKWSLQWCLTIPSSAPPIAPPGIPAIIIKQTKMLFFIQLTRIGMAVPPGQEAQTIVLPIVYDMSANTTQVTDPNHNKRDNPNSTVTIVNQTLKRFSDYNSGYTAGECTLFPSIKELVMNLVLPHDGGEVTQRGMPGGGPQQFVSMGAHPAGIMPPINPMPQPQV